MEKIFEIVSSLIPEEQHADVKAKINGALEETINENNTSLKKQLSEDYDVNLFAESKEEAYKNKNFVRAEEFKKIVGLNDELTKKVEESESTLQTYVENDTYNKASVELLKKGFNAERLSSIKPLLKGEGEVEDKVKEIEESFPELFLKGERETSVVPKKSKKRAITQAEEYFKSKQKK